MKKRVIAIIGGMGPLASSEFVKSIYEKNINKKEQEGPIVFLYSDPKIKDRSKLIEKNNDHFLLKEIKRILRYLRPFQPYRIIVCCVTAHSVLSALDARFKKRIISLVDIIIKKVARRKKKCLMLCTKGAIKRKIFHNNPHWREAEKYVIFPSKSDQIDIHRMIYKIKANYNLSRFKKKFESYSKKYGTNLFVAGCTEFHLINKYFIYIKYKKISFIDPLLSIAKELNTSLSV